MNILGISALYHDSAACLVCDGQIVAAAQEERFSRKRHDSSFPTRAIEFCLREGKVAVRDLEEVVFYDKPVLKFSRLLETYVAAWPAGFEFFSHSLPSWLRTKLNTENLVRSELGSEFVGDVLFTHHHESHAASAFFPSPFQSAAILTLDGVGEWTTTALGRGGGNKIELLEELRFPHSIGLLYSALTYFCGFRVNSGEYKLMGLAPYGSPIYRKKMEDELVDLRPDGSFRLNPKYFAFCHKLVMTRPSLEGLLGKKREPLTPLLQRHADIAASIQSLTEEVVLRLARTVRQKTGERNLVMAGGVALNCCANGKLLRSKIFDHIWVQPAAGDAGGALGAALFAHHQLHNQPRRVQPKDSQRGAFLGPSYPPEEIAAQLKELGANLFEVDSEDELCKLIATELAHGRVVAHFHGRAEFGPRALGNRSILADCRSANMQSIVNRKIKFRESFRPFAAAVLRADASEWFDVPRDIDQPYMLFVAEVQNSKKTFVTHSREASTIARESEALLSPSRLKDARSEIAAVTHVDDTCRVQTVDAERNPRLTRILHAFRIQTGCPLVLNTSFNVRGQPIVNQPREAFECFMATDIDLLVVERCVLRKSEQKPISNEDKQNFLTAHELD